MFDVLRGDKCAERLMLALWYKRSLELGKLAGALAVIFGIPYGIWQYLENKQEKRVEQTLTLFRQYNSAPFITYRERISTAVSKHKKAIADAVKDENQLKLVINDILIKEDIERDIWLILDFFDGVLVCVKSKICDPEVTRELFSCRAQDVFLMFYQYIAEQRNTAAYFGEGLETIAREKREC
jgi:hypothetical protein